MMKATFTCDDVFDVLTREPFPSGGADDEFVESHLAVCHECRQLAEAFRPAVGLFHEAIANESDDELPTYRGKLQPMIELLPERASESPKASRSWATFSFAIAASLMLVGSVVFATLAANQRDDHQSAVASASRIYSDRDYTLLAALEIPSDCRSLVESSAAGTRTEFVCCTKCHNSTSRVTSTEVAILKSSAACIACHDRMIDDSLSTNLKRTESFPTVLACMQIRNL